LHVKVTFGLFYSRVTEIKTIFADIFIMLVFLVEYDKVDQELDIDHLYSQISIQIYSVNLTFLRTFKLHVI